MLAGAAVLAVAALRRKTTPQHPKIRDVSWPANVAHRGALASFPENTLEAFEAGLAAGAGGLETDVHLTRDGKLAVIHDDTVERTTDGSGAIRDMTMAELRSLDAGYRFSPDGGLTHPYRSHGIRIPEFAEVLRRFPQACVNVEIKDEQRGVEEAMLRTIEDAKAEDRTLVASARHRVIRRFRRIAGERIATAASQLEIRTFYLFGRLRLEGLLNPAYVALQVPPRYRGVEVITARFIEAAHRRGIRVDAWTINEPDEMHRLLDLGVDGIMTDRPEVLARVLEERAKPG